MDSEEDISNSDKEINESEESNAVASECLDNMEENSDQNKESPVEPSIHSAESTSNNCDSSFQVKLSSSEDAVHLNDASTDECVVATSSQTDSAIDMSVSTKFNCSDADITNSKFSESEMSQYPMTASTSLLKQKDSGIYVEKQEQEMEMVCDNKSEESEAKDSEKVACDRCIEIKTDETNAACCDGTGFIVKQNTDNETNLSDNIDCGIEKAEQNELNTHEKVSTTKNKVLDSDDDSDTSGPNSFDLASCSVRKSSKSDSLNSNSDIEQEMDALDLFLSRRKRRHESDQDQHSSPDENEQSIADPAINESNETKSDSDGDDDEEEGQIDLDLTPPKDPWCPLKEMRSREIGYGNKLDTSHRVRTLCGSSVSLTRRLTRMCKLEHHEGCVNALHFNKSGTLLASGSDDLNIVIWDWLNMKSYFHFDSGHRSNVFQCKFMPYTGDSHIVSCARDGQIRLAELSSTGICKGTKKLSQHRGAAHKLALLEDSSHVFYSCGEDAVVYEIDLRQDKPNKLCTTKEKEKKIPLYSIHSNPFKSYEYCVGGRDHFLRVYDKRMSSSDGSEDPVVKKYCPHHLVDSEIKANVTCAVFSWDGQEVLGTYNDEDIYLFDNTHSDGAEFTHRYKGHRNNATVKGINFYGPKSEFIVSGSDCGNVFLWEKQSEKIVNYFAADTGGVVNVLEPHPHMPVLATSGLDHDVKVWTPLAREPSNLDGLAKCIKKNRKERERERLSEPEMLDGRMFWFLMRHLRRTRRRPGENGDSSTDSDDVERGDSDNTDNDEDEPMQCMPS